VSVDRPTAFTDREALRTEAYADPGKLRSRMSIYRYQRPKHDLRVHVRGFLRAVEGPVLDAGCGAGGYTRALREDGHRVVAADLSEGMTRSGGEPATVADITALPFAAGSFGGAIALHMLYHVDDPDAALAELRRVTAPGGIVVISTNAAGDKAALRRAHAIGAERAGTPLTTDGPSARFPLDLAQTMGARHFDSVQRHDLTSEVRVPVPDPVLTFIDSTRSWYGTGVDVMPHIRAHVEEVIAREGDFRFGTHSGFLVCR